MHNGKNIITSHTPNVFIGISANFSALIDMEPMTTPLDQTVKRTKSFSWTKNDQDKLDHSACFPVFFLTYMYKGWFYLKGNKHKRECKINCVGYSVSAHLCALCP